MRRLDHQRKTEFGSSREIRFLTEHLEWGRRHPDTFPDQLAAVLVHGDRRPHDTAAGVGNAE